MKEAGSPLLNLGSFPPYTATSAVGLISWSASHSSPTLLSPVRNGPPPPPSLLRPLPLPVGPRTPLPLQRLDVLLRPPPQPPRPAPPLHPRCLASLPEVRAQGRDRVPRTRGPPPIQPPERIPRIRNAQGAHFRDVPNDMGPPDLPRILLQSLQRRLSRIPWLFPSIDHRRGPASHYPWLHRSLSSHVTRNTGSLPHSLPLLHLGSPLTPAGHRMHTHASGKRPRYLRVRPTLGLSPQNIVLTVLPLGQVTNTSYRVQLGS